MDTGVTIRPSALVTTLAAPRIACFDRCLMAAAGPTILVRQRAMMMGAQGQRPRPRKPAENAAAPRPVAGAAVTASARSPARAASRTHVADSSAIAVQVTRGADMAAAPRNVGAPAGSAGHSLPG